MGTVVSAFCKLGLVEHVCGFLGVHSGFQLRTFRVRELGHEAPVTNSGKFDFSVFYTLFFY